MRNSPHFVIVGGGMAGSYAVDTLRKEGFDGKLTLIGGEPHRPYDRPPLSKEVLRAEKQPVYFHPEEHYAEIEVEMRLGRRAVALDPLTHQVELAGEERLVYDKLLLCTGGAVRVVRVPGSDLPGIYYLRTLDDSLALREAIVRRPRVAVIGAGFIGSEVVSSARALGCDVTVIELEPVPLLRALGPEMGGIYAEIHREHGVDVRLGEGLAQFRGADRVEEVVTTTGSLIPCDVAVVGVGIRPDVGWLEDSGLALDNGVVVDEHCRASAPDVFAAGDVANWYHPRTRERLRVEHWDNAMNQGAAAARSMLGKSQPYAPVPYFWSDQYDLNLQYVGHATAWEQVIFRGDVAGRSFSAFYLEKSRLVAALVVNRFKDLRPSRRLIEAMVAVDPAALADESTDLRGLARSLAGG